jgi:hypothetical protein
MLTLLLLLTASPQATGPLIPTLPAPPPPPGAAAMPVPGLSPLCASRLTRATDTVSGGDLMWREGGAAVGHYLLLDRHVGGCPDPIVVNHRAPGSNALGREVGRDNRPVPTAPRFAPTPIP